MVPRRGFSLATTLAFQSSATSQDSATITGPADIIAGDLLVLSDVSMRVSSNPTTVVPSDFDIEQNAVADVGFGMRLRHILSSKIATGAEASASLTGMGHNAKSKILFVFRPDNPITSKTGASGGGVVSTGNPSSQNVAAASGTPPLVVIGGYACISEPFVEAGIIDPRTFSPAKTAEVQIQYSDGAEEVEIDHWLAYRIYNTGPADTSIDMDDEDEGNSLVSRHIQVS
jgi:hypothetical protein